MRNVIVEILLIILVSVELQSQQISFRYITSEDGISQSEVYCFLHDSRGYMWIGTLDGLNRYDGYNIQTFLMSEDDPNGLAHNTIYSIVEDKFGRIWIGTTEGLNLYVPERQQMFSVPNFFAGKQTIIRALFADDRNLWIGTSKGLFRMTIPANRIDEMLLKNLSDKTDHVDIEIHGEPSIYSSVREIINSGNNKIWLATWEGLCCFEYNPAWEEHYKFYDLPEDLEKIESINTLEIDRNNNLWIGTNNSGLYRSGLSTGSFASFSEENTPQILSNSIMTTVIDQQGDLWIGTFKDGINRIQSDHLSNESPEMQVIQNNEFQPGSLSSNLIRQLYVSRDGIVWIGTLGRGVNFYNPNESRFTLHRIPPDKSTGRVNNFFRAIYPENDSVIWLGLHNDGLFKYNVDQDQYTHMGPDWFFTVFHILPVDDEHMWVATSEGTHLIKIHPSDVEVLTTVNFDETQEIVAYNACFNVERCTDTVFYVASMSGIARIGLNNTYQAHIEIFNEESVPSLPFSNIRVFKYDSLKNVLWAGSEGYGLQKIFLDENFDPVHYETYQNIPGDSTSLSSDYIRSLCLDRNRDLWIGTYEGLNRTILNDQGSIQQFKRWKGKDGLPNNMIQSIEEDSDGNLWIGSNGGLSKYIKEEDRFFNYRISDGLQSNEFSEHTSYYSREGKMFFGGINGFNVFVPQHIPSSPVFPEVKFIGFYLRNRLVTAGMELNNHIVLDKAIDMTDTLIFRPGENDLRFDFSAMYYANPGKIRYMYQLEGYDQDWIVTNAHARNANYTNLPSGKYHFKVKASNNADLWGDDAASIYIHIKTPYALRWWAWIIYLGLFVIGILYFTNYSVIRIATKKKLVLENEHNQRLHELDDLRTRFFINVSHDLRTPLTLILGPLQKVYKELEGHPPLQKQIDLINRNAKRLKYLVEQLLDIRRIESGKLILKPMRVDLAGLIKNEVRHFEPAFEEKGLAIDVHSRDEQLTTLADPNMISKLVFNLLSNALKYTDEGSVNVTISKVSYGELKTVWADCKRNDYIKIDIKDTGRGIEEEKQQMIFERFYQSAGNDYEKGYGIGLSHSRDLVEAHQGYIMLDSHKGIGSTFTVFLPLVSPEEAQFSSLTQIVSKPSHDFPEIAARKEIMEISDAIPGIDDGKKTVLIVDDNPDLREYLRTGLAGKYNIFEAVDGKDGLGKAESFSPDMIVSDVMMPEMDGLDFCRKIKSRLETSHIPIILLTAKSDSETKFRGIEEGADDYISKPFNLEYLQLRIENIFKSRERLKNLFRSNIELEPSEVTITSADEKFLKELMEVTEKGIPETDFTVEKMEQALGMSHTNFYKKVKSLTGMSGKELLQSMRWKRAMHLLSQEKLRISEIAYMSGFNSPKYFTRCFKEKYGVSPSKYQAIQTMKYTD